MHIMTSLLFLDVDGTIFPFVPSHLFDEEPGPELRQILLSKRWLPDTAFAHTNSRYYFYSPSIIAALDDLVDDIFIVSSWVSKDSNKINLLKNLCPELKISGVIETQSSSSNDPAIYFQEEKLDPVLSALDSRTFDTYDTVIWIDDDMTSVLNLPLRFNVKTITPNPDTGVTLRQVNLIKNAIQ